MPGQRSKLRWIIWVLAASFYFYELVLRTSPTVMVDELMLAFGVDAAVLGSLSAFYFYAYAPMQLPAGLLMDRYGTRRLISLAVLLCGIGQVFFSLAHHLWVAESGRLFTGIGSSVAFIGIVYVSAHYFRPERLALLIGLGNSIGMLGSFVGEGPLAVAVEHLGWRGPSLFLGVVGIALAFVFYFTIKGAPIGKRTNRSDSLKQLWENLCVVTRNPQTWLNSVIAGCLFIPTSVFAGLWADPFLQTAHQLPKDVASFASSMVFIGWIIGGPITGRISDKMGKRRPVLMLCTLFTLLSLIPVIYLPSLPVWLIFLLLLLVGMFSTGELLNFSIAIELNPPKAKGTSTALTNFFIAAFAALFQPLVGIFLDLASGETSNQLVYIYTATSYRIALSCFPIILVIALILTLFLHEKAIGSRT